MSGQPKLGIIIEQGNGLARFCSSQCCPNIWLENKAALGSTAGAACGVLCVPSVGAVARSVFLLVLLPSFFIPTAVVTPSPFLRAARVCLYVEGGE